ncbi:MAG: ERF family protein, partial [Candidatus Thioglobus sp.]
GVKKTAKNPFFKSSYADLNGVMDSLAPALVECNLIYVQYANRHDGVDVLTTELVNVSKPDEKIISHTHLVIPSADMQKLGGAITYARRYSLISLFSLEAIDDDGNVASGKEKPLSATQLHNARINDAKATLDRAKKEENYDLASDIYDFAKKEGFIQVCDYYDRLFESNNNKEGM